MPEDDARNPEAVERGDGRHETPVERSDRNWGELLQEFRVTQTGTQIISGFLLTLAFQQRFSRLDAFQLTVYVVLVLLAATTTAVGLAPVALHRVLFRRHKKPRMVGIGSALLVVDIALVAILTGGVAFFIVDVVAGLAAGTIAGIAMVLLLAGLLVYLPRRVRRIDHDTP
jgi:hypothetical protein